MSYKPDEATLISYLYGELGETEREKVHRYLTDHPSALKDMQERADMLGILSTVEDKEVIAPTIMMDQTPHVRSFWQHGPFKTIIGIAASLVLIMIAARLIGIEMQYASGELRISFGEVKRKEEVIVPAVADTFTAQEAQQMIDEALTRNNRSLTASLSASQERLDQTVRQLVGQNSKKMNELVNQVSAASQNQVRDYVYNMQVENVRLMKDYMTLSVAEQHQYMEDLLTDFAGYLHKQHEQDLVQVQTRVDDIEQNTDQFKQATEQILASIISTKGDNSSNNY